MDHGRITLARIVNLADPDNAELFPSLEAAKEAFAAWKDNWRKQGWEVIDHEDEENRCTVSDDTGQFIGEFYVED